MSPRAALVRGFLLAAALGAVTGAAGAQLAVRARLADQQLETTVDSEIARYYLVHHLDEGARRAGGDRELDEQLAGLAADPGDREGLRLLTERYSTDLATLHFVARAFEDPENRRAQLAFHEYVSELGAGREGGSFPHPGSGVVMAFVPGYAYKKDRGTGADFALQRELAEAMGLENVLIETDDVGDVEDNAAVVRRELRRLASEYEEILVVSASKGGPEVALALGEDLAEETRSAVKVWISVGGLLRGSPYADRALEWPRSWLARAFFGLRGLRAAVIENLSTRVRIPVFERLRLPPELLTLQYVGVPLSGHIGRETRGRYGALKHLGPNDGLTLLADEIVPGGIVVTDLGLDHYYRDPAIDKKTLALTYVVLDELEGRRRHAKVE